jgi:uncharacterized protein with ATP-grasp and redox domains
MQTTLDCVPCFVRQTLDALRFISDDTELHRQILSEVLTEAASLDFSQSPPAFAQQIHRHLRKISGNRDPYLEVKTLFNRIAEDLAVRVKIRINSANNPFEAAVKVAIAGNVIDFGINGNIAKEDVQKEVFQILSSPLQGNSKQLWEALQNAERILYLADNAGEIIFDRLLIERMPFDRTVLAVRGKPILNDATREDAKYAGLDKLVKVIDNGSDAPGTILSDCSSEFREHYENADLIISKGQGNYETLSNRPENIFFLMKVKCPVIALHTELPVGTHLLLKNQIAGDESCQDTMEQDRLAAAL